MFRHFRWHSDRQDLAAIKGLSEAKVDKLIEACSKLHVSTFFEQQIRRTHLRQASSFITAYEALNKRKQVLKLTTGSGILDKLLGTSNTSELRFTNECTCTGGGVETMGITEAFGEFRTGKRLRKYVVYSQLMTF